MLIEFKNKIYEGSNSRKSLFDCQIPKKAKAVIIFAHGYKGYKDWGAWNLMEAYFLKQNFGFVKFNMSHNGGTVEEPIDFPDLEAFGKNTYTFEINDLDLMINETDRIIRQECEMDIPIFLIGHSRGAGVAILTAAQNNKVSKLISLAGISNIGNRFPSGDQLLDWEFGGVMYVQNGRTNQAMPHFYTFYEDFKKNEEALDIEIAATSLSMPFLQIHGDMDLAVSISEGQAVASWTETRLSIVKGAGHTFSASQPWEHDHLPQDMESALEKALEFFNEI
ncbi:MAG: pimeloyl-ACP methyl ester carboxylesterase [Crocinitomix sp.]|jgi:pimeloyl-ACP methyl ester carboxylesterase